MDVNESLHPTPRLKARHFLPTHSRQMLRRQTHHRSEASFVCLLPEHLVLEWVGSSRARDRREEEDPNVSDVWSRLVSRVLARAACESRRRRRRKRTLTINDQRLSKSWLIVVLFPSLRSHMLTPEVIEVPLAEGHPSGGLGLCSFPFIS